MSVAVSTATLTVTTGPDRGQTFALTDEFVHIGRGPESQILLTDPQVAEHQASLANRNGRFAIFSPIDNAVVVDGNALTADQWAWLPAQATIKVSSKTTLVFSAGASSSSSEHPSPTATPVDSKLLDAKLPDSKPSESKPAADDAPPKPKPPEKRKPAAKRADSTGTTGRAVAKFITDRPGETLVRLGEDGHLPELALSEVSTPKVDKRKQSSQGNPALIYGALGFSLLASIAMLFLDPQSLDERATSKAEARSFVMRSKFIGDEKGPVKPFQRLLREAGLAHSRGDYKSERDAYNSVLGLLNSEDKNPFTGITGNAEDDEELKKKLAVLLGR
jgi:hypothetical protein